MSNVNPDQILGEQVGSESRVNRHDDFEETSFLDLLLILGKRKRLIFINAFLGCLISAMIAFVIKPIYTATALIMPPQQQTSSAAAFLNQLGGMAGLASQSLGIKNPSDLYVGMLNSRTIADGLISQFGLMKVYKSRYWSDARKELQNRTQIGTTKYSLIQISVEDEDPKRAANMANSYVDKLLEQNSRLAVTEASQRRLFFEGQVEAEKEKLARAEVDFKKLQEGKGIYQVGSQVEVVIRSMAQMRAELAAREVNLERLKAGATKQNPEVLRQEIELEALRNQLQQLEKRSEKRSNGDPLLPTTMVPEAGLEYTRQLREVKYRETLFELLSKQYEAAKIDEAKEAPIIQVVDRAVPPDRRSSPVRSLYVLSGVLLGAFLGVMLALVGHAWGHPRNNPKLSELKQILKKQ